MTLPTPLHIVNEGLAFLLELVALAVLAWWGWHVEGPTAVRLLLAVAVPAAAAVLWGVFAAPKARIPVPLAGVLTVKALVFGAAATALYAVGSHRWGTVFAVIVAANTVLATLDRHAAFHKPS